jgi:predicted nucleic acid-binding protein
VRVLIDTNVVLDFLLQREPFFQDVELLFQAIDTGAVVGYIMATTLTDIFYISRRHTRSIEQARQAVSEMLTAMAICPLTDLFWNQHSILAWLILKMQFRSFVQSLKV